MKRKIGRGIIYCLAIIWGILTILPLFITFICSVKDNVGINLSMLSLPRKWLWSNYVDAFQVAHIGKAVLNSIFLGISTTLLVSIVALLAAYVLSRKRFRLRGAVSTLFIVGVMVPVHCTIIPISNLAVELHGKNTLWMLILIYTAFNLAQAIFLFTGYMNGIDRELDEAAIMDGCNDFQVLFQILTPVCTPILSTEAILAFISAYGELIFSMTLLSDPNKYTASRAMLVFSSGHDQLLGPIFASVIIVVLPMLILYTVFHEKVQDGMMTGAVKG